MSRPSDATRLERLELLKAHLRSEEATTIGELAARLETSARTVRRDLDVLRDQGLPIESERGRGGGVRLKRGWGVGRVNLTYSEAVDLLVSVSVAERMRSPLLMANLDGARRKLVASFSSTMSKKVRGLKARILVGPAVPSGILTGYAPPSRSAVAQLHQAFLNQCRAVMSYRSSTGELTKRTIEPHYLLLCLPVWYVLSWDRLRSEVRTFRCDRIERIHQVEQPFQVLPLARFREALEGIDAA
ncbi:MAG: WYL domain-containing protein [Myxococcales bacterium]|nr:WYL domain-containing protein [Myxococcales bacterium]